MFIPIRCTTCGKPIAHLWEQYNKRVGEGEEQKKVLDSLGLKKYCCRTTFLTNVDLVKKISKFKR